MNGASERTSKWPSTYVAIAVRSVLCIVDLTNWFTVTFVIGSAVLDFSLCLIPFAGRILPSAIDSLKRTDRNQMVSVGGGRQPIAQ